jgi:hypothetical protein
MYLPMDRAELALKLPNVFIEGVRHATARGHFQMTTDGFALYRSAISTTLHDRCDFAQLIKVYRAPQDGARSTRI